MAKNRKHEAEFKLQVIEEHVKGHPVNFLSKKYEISRSLIRKWIDHHRSNGTEGLLPKSCLYYPKEFKLKVVKAYKDKRLSLRDCCLRFNIPTQSTISSWVRRYEQLGINGLNEQKGRPKIMKKDKPAAKKTEPLTRLEELEKENLYLRAEIDLLKKLDALTLQKQTRQKKKR
jgi:transposase